MTEKGENDRDDGLRQARQLREYVESLPPNVRVKGAAIAKQIGQAAIKCRLLRAGKANERLSARALVRMRKFNDYYRVENGGQE